MATEHGLICFCLLPPNHPAGRLRISILQSEPPDISSLRGGTSRKSSQHEKALAKLTATAVDGPRLLVLRPLPHPRPSDDLQQHPLHYRPLPVHPPSTRKHPDHQLTTTTTRVTFSTHLPTRYGGVFIGVIGICGNVPTNFAYQHNNTVGQSKRAMCATIMTMGGACGGIISGNIFIASEAPTFVSGIATCICFQVSLSYFACACDDGWEAEMAQCIAILLVAKNLVYFTRCNRKADRGEMVIQGQPGFRFTL